MPIDFVEESAIDFKEESAPIDFAAEPPAQQFREDLTLTPARSPEELSARNFYRQLSASGIIPTVEHSDLWDNATRPIEPLASWATEGGIQKLVLQALPESAKQTTAGKIATGTQAAVDDAVKSFVSPLGIATLGIGALPKAAQSVIASAFAAHMASTLPEQTKAAVQSIKEGDTEAAARHITGTAITGAMVGMGGKHAIQSGRAALNELKVESAKVVGPATAAAVGAETAPEAPPAPVERATTLEAPKAELEVPKVGEAVQYGAVKGVLVADEVLPSGGRSVRMRVTESPDASTVGKEVGVEPAQLKGLGAATPAEFELKPQNQTSIKNATVDQERAARGLPPAMEPARRSFGTVWDQAMAKMDADYQYPDRLVAELREKPRAITDLEDATLLHRQVELQNEYTKAARDLAQAFDDGRLEDVELQKVRVAGLSDQLLDLYNINKAAGTETARGLNARKMLAYEDFSLAKMELEKRAAKGGEQLTDAERAEVVRVNKQVDQTQKAYDEYVARTEERARGEASERAMKEVEALEPPKEPLEKITESLQEKFMAGQSDAITSLIQKLARYFVAQGIKERDPLLAAVHDVVKTIDPTLTPRDTMDAISGYGKYRRLSKDEISRELRDLRGQMQQVAKLEDMEAKRPPLKTGSERRVPSVEERRLIRLVNEAKNKFQVPITDEATQLKSSLDMLKTRLRNRMGELEDKLARKDFTKAPRRVIQLDAEAQRLHFEAAKVKARWHEALMKDRLARRSVPQKIIGGIGEVLNTTRAILTSLDLSAVLRQGGFITLAHPIRAARAFPAMFRALRSEAGQHRINQEIMARKNYALYQQSKLYLAEHGQKLSQMEEAYMSRWADKIPLVAGSQRAYVTFLNKLRADSFDAMTATLSRTGEVTPVEAQAIANFINVATGRGKLGVNDNWGAGLSTVFFAPRYVASRFQLIGGQPFYKGNLRSRKLIAQEYARFLAGIGIVYGLAQMAGGEIETDPRSSDFGKVRLGDTRLDPLAGLQQVTVLLERTRTGETKKLSGEIVPIVGPDVPYGQDNYFEVLANFTRTKLSPILASYIDVRTGEDVVGKPVTLTSETLDLATPLALKDILKTMEEQGVPRGTALAILSIFGMGLQTYDR